MITPQKSPRFRKFSFLFLAASPVLATPPVIGTPPYQVIPKNTSTGDLEFVVADADVALFSSINVTAAVTAASPGSLASQLTLTLGSVNTAGSARFINVTHAGGNSGTATITLTAADAGGTPTSTSFDVKVIAPVAAPPAFTYTAPSGFPGYLIVTPGTTPADIDITLSAGAGPYTLTATSSNTALVPNGWSGGVGLNLTGTSPNFKLQVRPSSGVSGVATINLVAANSNGSGRYTKTSFIFCVYDAATEPVSKASGIYLLDSSAGVGGSGNRDQNLNAFNNATVAALADGYVLRPGWSLLESSMGTYNTAILDNIVKKLAGYPGKKLSLIIGTPDPAYLGAGASQTWNDGGTTRAVPWDATVPARRQALISALANSQVDHDNNPSTPTIAFKNYTGLKVLNPYMSGGHTGLRDPIGQRLYQMTGYSRAALLAAAKVEIDAIRTYFISGASPVPSDRFVHIGFWPLEDTSSSPELWEYLSDELRTTYNGASPTAIGFFMENLAATKVAQEADTADGTPVPSYGAPLIDTDDFAYTGFQELGNFSRPFNRNHVYKTVNGTPGASMEYAYNTYRCRYFEVYISDLQSPALQPELKRWRDFLAALPN